ncbi:unnamed protein product [Caenorhabditis nigoni]
MFFANKQAHNEAKLKIFTEEKDDEPTPRHPFRKLLIIDEISMCDAKLLRRVEKRMRQLMRNDLPFGGCTTVSFGDILQIPPVPEKGPDGIPTKVDYVFEYNGEDVSSRTSLSNIKFDVHNPPGYCQFITRPSIHRQQIQQSSSQYKFEGLLIGQRGNMYRLKHQVHSESSHWILDSTQETQGFEPIKSDLVLRSDIKSWKIEFQIQPAYAFTYHKSQGQTLNAVFLPVEKRLQAAIFYLLFSSSYYSSSSIYADPIALGEYKIFRMSIGLLLHHYKN